MWICCITVHIVIDQIFDNRLSFSFNFFVNTTPGCGLLKNWILFWQIWGKKNAWTFDFVLNLKLCFILFVFLHREGEVWTLHFWQWLGVAGRWAPRRMLPNVFPSDAEATWWSVLSLCVHALISARLWLGCYQSIQPTEDLRPPSTSSSSCSSSGVRCVFLSHLSRLRL